MSDLPDPVVGDGIEDDPAEDDATAPPEDGLFDRLRGTGVGVEDPNIVGDVGPTDVPPGRDAPGDGLLADPPVPD